MRQPSLVTSGTCEIGPGIGFGRFGNRRGAFQLRSPCEPAHMMTCFFSKLALTAYPVGSEPIVQVLLQWQVGQRGTAQAIIDIGTGTVVRLPCQLVTATPLYSGKGPIYQVSGAVVDNSSSSPPNQFTDPLFVAGGSTSIRFKLPDFASSVRFLARDQVYNLTAQFYGSPTAVSPIYQGVIIDASALTIPGGAEYADFSDTGGGSDGMLVYSLTL